MKVILLSCVAALSLGVVACDNKFEDKPAAKVTQKVEAEAAKKAKAEKDRLAAAESAKAKSMPASLKVDVSGSSIGWVGAKVTGKHEGDFKEFVGSADVQGDTLKGLSFEVNTGSVTSDAPKLTGHLKSDDFFQVEKHPKASFKATSISAKVESGNTHEITGDLSLRGVSKSITFPAKVTFGPKSVSGESEFTINRKDFGIEYAGMKDDLIKDDVLLKLKLVFPRG